MDWVNDQVNKFATFATVYESRYWLYFLLSSRVLYNAILNFIQLQLKRPVSSCWTTGGSMCLPLGKYVFCRETFIECFFSRGLVFWKFCSIVEVPCTIKCDYFFSE